MYKKILILSLSFLLSGISYGQFFHLGAKGFYTPATLMNYYEYDVTDYVYYFSNQRNETVRFSGFKTSSVKSNLISPAIYMRYELGNHIFFQADFFHLSFHNEAEYKNSVDYKDFVDEFNPDGNIDNLEYNTIKLKWKFWGNSLSLGYRLAKAKALRPHLYIGATVMYLENFQHYSATPINEDYQRDINQIIFKNLDTYKITTFYYHFGIGFKYHAVTLNAYIMSSIPNQPVDIYADKYEEGNISNDISLSERANYKSLSTLNLSLGINLLSFNLTKKDLKY